MSDGFDALVCFDVGVEGDDVAVEEARVGGDSVLDGGEALEEVSRVGDCCFRGGSDVLELCVRPCC